MTTPLATVEGSDQGRVVGSVQRVRRLREGAFDGAGVESEDSAQPRVIQRSAMASGASTSAPAE